MSSKAQEAYEAAPNYRESLAGIMRIRGQPSLQFNRSDFDVAGKRSSKDRYRTWDEARQMWIGFEITHS